MSKTWKGESELKEVLNDLSAPVTNAKLKSACSICMKYQNEYKMVVFEIEKYIKKASLKDKAGGIFLIDAVCKSSKALSKDTFTPRFALRIKDTIASIEFDNLSTSDKVNCLI